MSDLISITAQWQTVGAIYGAIALAVIITVAYRIGPGVVSGPFATPGRAAASPWQRARSRMMRLATYFTCESRGDRRFMAALKACDICSWQFSPGEKRYLDRGVFCSECLPEYRPDNEIVRYWQTRDRLAVSAPSMPYEIVELLAAERPTVAGILAGYAERHDGRIPPQLALVLATGAMRVMVTPDAARPVDCYGIGWAALQDRLA